MLFIGGWVVLLPVGGEPNLARYFKDLRRTWVFFMYGYGKYGGWAVSGLTLVFSFLTMMRLYLPFLPVTVDLAVLIGAGVVFAVAMVVLGARAMSMRRVGVTVVEHALLTANNPVWSAYLRQYLLLTRLISELSMLAESMNGDDEARTILEELRTELNKASRELAKVISEYTM